MKEQVALDKILINKLKNKFNVADLLIKHLTNYEVNQIIECSAT